MAGSRRATLEARLPDIPRERLRDLTEQLGDSAMPPRVGPRVMYWSISH